MKKILTLSLIAIFALAATTFTGCKKYDDGPLISLRFKKARLVNTWKIEKIIKNGQQQSLSNDNKNSRYQFSKDGTFTLRNTSTSVSYTGTWVFTDSKEKLKVIYSMGKLSINYEYTILRLKKKELWLKQDDDGDTIETHYVPE